MIPITAALPILLTVHRMEAVAITMTLEEITIGGNVNGTRIGNVKETESGIASGKENASAEITSVGKTVLRLPCTIDLQYRITALQDILQANRNAHKKSAAEAVKTSA